MTVSYNLDMSTSSSGSFARILFRWRGSVWKSVLNEFIVWTIMYYFVFFIYKNFLSDDAQKEFEAIAKHIDDKINLLPLTFMLGFFVTIVVDRWKQIFQNIGFVDSAAFFINTYIRGNEPEIRVYRRNIIRYLCLTQVLVLRDTSVQVRKRFPNMDSVVDSGLLLPHERDIMDSMRNGFSKYWMPINWIFTLSYELRQRGNIAADVLLNSLLQEVKYFREKLQTLCNYDWVPVPLAYPQVVFLAVRIYFLLCLFCRQYRFHGKTAEQNDVDRYIPLVTMLQLIFIMGWLKVAEALLNPLGEDDDDFECNYIIDRNIAIAMTMIDDYHDQKPAQMLEQFVPPDGYEPLMTPLYSEHAASQPQHPLVGSATNANLPEEKEHVRMVGRTPSDRLTGIGMENLRTNNLAQNLERRHSNFLVRRLSSMSLSRFRNLRHQTSLPVRDESGGNGAKRNINGNVPVDKGTAKEDSLETGRMSPREINLDRKSLGGGRRPNSLGLTAVSTAPEIRQSFSPPTSPLTPELRSLQMHYLEPVEERREDDDDEQQVNEETDGEGTAVIEIRRFKPSNI